jgi:AcrR family transcriptional regulator
MSSTTDSGRKKGGKRERTRAALAAAALEVVAEKGFAGASLEEIAARAGMTKGAIYSNFSGKADLLMSAMSAKGFAMATERPAAASVGEELREVAEALVVMVRRAKDEEAFLAEFQLYALADPELRQGMAAVYAESFTGTATYLAKLRGSMMPARELAVAIQAVSLGFLLQSLVTPNEVTDTVVRGAFKALAAGLDDRKR